MFVMKWTRFHLRHLEAWEVALLLCEDGDLDEISLGAAISAMGTRWKDTRALSLKVQDTDFWLVQWLSPKMSKVYQSAEKWEYLTPILLLLWHSLPSKQLVFRIVLGIRNCSKKDWFWREEGLKHRSDGKTHGGLVHDSWRIDMNLWFYVWICFVSRVSYVSCDILMMFSSFWLGFALRRHLA